LDDRVYYPTPLDVFPNAAITIGYPAPK
jgi:hypothetical protein